MKLENYYQYIGRTFGRWTVVSVERVKSKTVFLCKCICGTCGSPLARGVLNGLSRSCGCLKNETTSRRKKTHGLSKTAIYLVWKRIRQRCYYNNNCNYKYYGGKGIVMCEEWQDFSNFHAWLLDNKWHSGLTIDRLDTNMNYCPDNCQLVSLSENVARNNSERTAAKKKRLIEGRVL